MDRPYARTWKLAAGAAVALAVAGVAGVHLAKQSRRDRLLVDLQSHDRDTRVNAEILLSDHPDPRALAALIRLLEPPHRSTQGTYAVRALVALGPASVPPLLDALRTGSADQRPAAVSALGWLKDARAVPYLIQATKDPDPVVARYAVGSLGHYSEREVRDRLLEVLRGGDGDLRLAACTPLAWLKEGRAVPELIAIVPTIEPAGARLSCTQALLRFPRAEVVEFLSQRLLTETPFVAMDLTRSLVNATDPAFRRTLDEAAEHGRADVVAAGYAYFLHRDPPIKEDLVMTAAELYGGASMLDALRASGRPALVRAAGRIEASRKGQPTMVVVE